MDRSANMRAVRAKNTAPEMAVRSLVHRLGYRFRLHGKNLSGKPDLVFASRRKVILVHGCFWHRHGCKRSTLPKTNRDFWSAKLRKNKARDRKTLKLLAEEGWQALVVWQCELKDTDGLTQKLSAFLDEPYR